MGLTREIVRAERVTHLEDRGTWECDQLVRLDELDEQDGSRGYGLANVEGTVTLSFRAKGLTIGGLSGLLSPNSP